MGTFWPGKLCPHLKRAIEELVKGRDMATHLQILLGNPSGDHGSVSAEELGVKIFRSFTEALSVLMSSCESGEVCQIPATTQVGSPSSGDRRSLDSGESSKRPAVKDRRGCYKRRKTSDSWIEVSSTLEDGHSWRKYGQKDILNAKFPRSYYRCTHKNDQGCPATKQVQRIQEETQMYQTTYFGHHTCRATLNSPQNILDSDPVESHPVSLESKFSSHEQDHPSPKTRSDQEDFISGVHSPASTSSHDLDMDFLIESVVDFHNNFPFDETEFLKDF